MSKSRQIHLNGLRNKVSKKYLKKLNGNKTLEAVEVLTILQYANGIIGSLTL